MGFVGALPRGTKFYVRIARGGEGKATTLAESDCRVLSAREFIRYRTDGATGVEKTAQEKEVIVTENEVFDQILTAVNNNLNSPEAFAVIDESELTFSDWQKVDELFGLRLIEDTPDIDDETRRMIFERETARDRKDWAEADRLRGLLAERGIGVKDTPAGSVWEYLA